MKTKVICPICNKKFKSLMSHVIRKHMPMLKFRALYPCALLISEATIKKTRKTCKRVCTCVWFKGKKLTKEHRKKISLVTKGKRNPFYGKKHTKETRLRMSKNHANFKGNKNPFKKAMKNKKFMLAFCKKLKRGWNKNKKDKVKYNRICDNASKRVTKLQQCGLLNSYGRGHKQGKYFSHKFKINFYYRSSYELAFIKFCENISMVEQLKQGTIVIKYKNKEGRIHRYLPDFLINNKFLIEVKADRLINFGVNPCKFKSARQYCRKNKLKFLIFTEKHLFLEVIKESLK